MHIAVVHNQNLVLECLHKAFVAPHTGIASVEAATEWSQLSTGTPEKLDAVLLSDDLGDHIPLIYKLNAMKSSDIPVVLMGAHPEPHEIQVALHGGAHSYVTGEDSVESVILALVEAGNGTDNSHTSENSLAEMPTSRAPSLSDQERTCVALVAAGWQMKQVAFYLGTTVETARGYLKNARAKYSANGIDIGSKMLLRLRAIHDGIISGTE